MDVSIFLLQWYSFIAWKFMNSNAKAKFRDVEKIEKKLVTLKLHLQFNEICLKENLLPVYTNQYIYIYIYTYKCGTREIFCRQSDPRESSGRTDYTYLRHLLVAYFWYLFICIYIYIYIYYVKFII